MQYIIADDENDRKNNVHFISEKLKQKIVVPLSGETYPWYPIRFQFNTKNHSISHDSELSNI